MKKAILFLSVLLISPLLASLGEAAYTIHLKNGGRFLTPLYWEEGHYVNFHVAGGVMGIEKKSVREIELVPHNLYQTVEVRKAEPPAAASAAEIESPVTGVPQMDARDDSKKDPYILREYKALEKRFESRKGMSVDELRYLKNDLTVLREKIVQDRLKYDFLEEVNKIADMRFFVNDLLLIKSKNR